ncbi:TniB family NTP-binding protein [Celeribacter indicus]
MNEKGHCRAPTRPFRQPKGCARSTRVIHRAHCSRWRDGELRAGTTEEDGRIALIQSDIWIGFPRAEQVLDRLQGMIEAPRQTRMPGLLVHGASGIGKTMIARNLSRKYAPDYDPASGITRTPLLLLQAPPAPDERRFYLHILAAVGAPATALSARAQNVASLEVRVIALLRDLGLRMIMIDEVHNLLAGTHREQRRFLNVLRYLSNELEVSLVCLGVSEAVDAIRGDIQLARRLDEHHLPNWRDDAEFSDMIQTLIAAMPLEKKSNLKVKSLKQILALTGGVTSRIFALIKDLSIDAIGTGEECITDDAIAKWTPVWSRHANSHRRLEKSGV